MTKWIQCPQCRIHLSLEGHGGGDRIRCEGCGATLAVPAYAETGTPRAAKGRTSALFRRMSGARVPGGTDRPPSRASAMVGAHRSRPVSQNSRVGIIVAGVIGGVALLGVLLYFAINKDKNKGPEAKKEQAKVAAPPDGQPREEEKKKKPEEKDTSPREKKTGPRTPSGDPTRPAAFESGAEQVARKEAKDQYPAISVNDSLLRQYDSLASRSEVSSIVKEDFRWMPCVLLRVLSDDEKIARTSFRALSAICVNRKISSNREGDPFKNPINMDHFNSRLYRGTLYLLWAGEWYPKNRAVIASWDPSRPVEYAEIDADKADWNRLIRNIRAGGAFDEPDRPEGQAIAQIRAMGRKGWVKLVSFLDHEELTVARSVAKALNYLTGQDRRLPIPGTKLDVKKEWEHWLKKH